MHWIGVVAFVGFVAIVAILTWAVKSHSREKSVASDKARKAGDTISRKIFGFTDLFLQQVEEGGEPEQAAEKLRSETNSLIPGQQGVLPTTQHIKGLSAAVFKASVSESTRRTVMVIVFGTAAVATVTLIICSVLYQFHSDAGVSSPAASGTSQPLHQRQFSQPKFKFN